ncbi:MAG TPA: hypothetical protein PK573_02255 [Spirochaetota bacterium]|nr:hypothetical protein [Spirochaetota bacterium]HRZ28712.1 hypothetical protein [Spirochaetota bacterium]
MNIILSELRRAYVRRGGSWNKINIFGIQNEGDQALDSFNDLIGFECDGSVRVFPGTTDPGIEATEKKSGGAAHLCLGYHRDIWMIGIHAKSNQAFAHEAFIQTGNEVVIWRDRDRDGVQDETDPVERGYFGINLHRASIHGSKIIGAYSYGCQVLQNPADLQIILSIAKQTGQRTFSYMLFDRDEFYIS